MSEEKMKRLFLIDGHSLIFRMYYAFLRRPMVNSKGEDTSIIYGFTKYLLELVRKEQPTHLAVAFDPPAKTFRHEMCPDYKATRSAAPELVKEALDPLSEIVRALGVPVVMMPGFEADDVIGSMARKWAGKGFDVFMVTPDKDLGQIIDEHIFQYKPGKQGAEDEIVGRDEICRRMGISTPLQIIDILSIWGDAADNIKGVNGVGEVGAKKLVAKYGSLEGILEHTDELPPKQKAAFEEARGHLALSKALATIKTDLDIPLEEGELKLDIRCSNCLSGILDHYEMNSLRKLLPQDEVQEKATPVKNSIAIEEVGEEELRKLILSEAEVSFSCKNDTVLLCCGGKYAALTTQKAADILTDKDIRKVGHSLKDDIKKLIDKGVEVKGEIYDIELMHYLLNPERTHKIEILASSYLNVDLEEQISATATPNAGGSGGNSLEDLFAANEPAEQDIFSTDGSKTDPLKSDSRQTEIFNTGGAAAQNTVQQTVASDDDTTRKMAIRCEATSQICDKLIKELEEQSLMELYLKIEMPLVKVLARMEHDGVKVDPRPLNEYSRTLSQELLQIEAQAREMAGEPMVNLSSPKQVGIILYEKLNLNPKAKKSKSGSYPTDEETLNDIRDRHPFVGKILEFRATRKLISTYLEPLPTLINRRTGKIHTTFNQALTATGRLSSVKPNLQNIPIRTEKGREIRKAFVPGTEGGFIVSADYSQIELRIMAHLSQDPSMTEAFREGADIHTETASKIFHLPFEEVSKEQRRRAKVANFGIIYGISSFGLAQRMEIPRSEAKEFIEHYFTHFPKVKEYMDFSIEKARQSGYAQTIFGRKRYLPDINSRNQTVRALAERNAINAPIQGSAADIIKLAMNATASRLEEAHLKSRMVLQVHDELVFDVVADELEELMSIVKYEMENVCQLSVPLTVECNYGSNWLEAH